MGVGVENGQGNLHAQPTGAINFALARHRGDLNINDVGPDIGIDGFGDLVEAATDQTAFDTAAEALMGTWYSGKPTDWKSAEFRIYAAIKDRLGV